MINSIIGVITGKFPKQIFLENNGIEFDMGYDKRQVEQKLSQLIEEFNSNSDFTKKNSKR